MIRRMTVRLTWSQALAWRMRRHHLDPIDGASVVDVVARLCGVQAQVASSAALAVAVRRAGSHPDDVASAIDEGGVIKTWAMHGALHLLSPREGAAFLALIAAARPWDRSSWQRHFDMNEIRWEALRRAVREALDGTALTREELGAAIGAVPGLAHLRGAMRSSWGTILKPLAWQGELCFGAPRDGRPTFMRPVDASPAWAGLPAQEDGIALAVEAYFGAFGPASVEAFGGWISGGWFGTRTLRTAVAALGDRLTEVEVDGDRVHVLSEHVDELAATRPTNAVRLLPGFDQYVLGPGTGDSHVIPAGRRAAVSRQSGWISPVVVAGGVVSGTWDLKDDRVNVAWFGEAGRMPRREIKTELDRLSATLGRDLGVALALA
jgi:Winged helix DNA-binding domain